MHPAFLTSSSSSLRWNRAGVLAAAAVAAASLGGGMAARGDTYANNGQQALNVATSWFDVTTNSNAATPPGAADIASFDSHSALVTATTFQLGTPTTWLGLLVTNPGRRSRSTMGQIR